MNLNKLTDKAQEAVVEAQRAAVTWSSSASIRAWIWLSRPLSPARATRRCSIRAASSSSSSGSRGYCIACSWAGVTREPGWRCRNTP